MAVTIIGASYSDSNNIELNGNHHTRVLFMLLFNVIDDTLRQQEIILDKNISC